MALIKIEPRTWRTFSALDSFGRYWIKSEELISQDADIEVILNQPKWQPEDASAYAEYQAEVASVRQFHDHTMKRTLRYACATFLYSLVETELDRFVENLQGQRLKKEVGKSFLETFAKCLENHFVRVKEFEHYQSLDNLRKVRNCIIHYRLRKCGRQ